MDTLSLKRYNGVPNEISRAKAFRLEASIATMRQGGTIDSP